MPVRFAPALPWSRPSSDPNDRFVGDLVAESASARSGFGLFGVPFDGAVLGRRGARGGPAAIRAELYKMKATGPDGAELRLPLRDFGDVEVPPDDVAAAHPAAEAAAREVVAAGLVPVALGGDHSLTYPLVAAHRGRALGVVNVDAHLDVREVVGGRINSGTSFGRLLADGVVGERLVAAGIRPFATSPTYFAKVAKHGALVLTADDVRADPEAAAVRAHARAAGGAPGGALYVSLDIDVLDQAHAPGVSAPTPGGLGTADLLRFLARLGSASRGGLAGFDVVETAPALDADGRTARAAAWAILTFLAGHGPP